MEKTRDFKHRRVSRRVLEVLGFYNSKKRNDKNFYCRSDKSICISKDGEIYHLRCERIINGINKKYTFQVCQVQDVWKALNFIRKEEEDGKQKD